MRTPKAGKPKKVVPLITRRQIIREFRKEFKKIDRALRNHAPVDYPHIQILFHIAKAMETAPTKEENGPNEQSADHVIEARKAKDIMEAWRESHS